MLPNTYAAVFSVCVGDIWVRVCSLAGGKLFLKNSILRLNPLRIMFIKTTVLLVLLCGSSNVFGQEMENEDTYDHHLDKAQGEPKQQQQQQKQCGNCVKEECASPSSCLAGVAPDRCGCCLVCARTEGELCDDNPRTGRFGVCGENLDCSKRKDVLPGEGEAICQCQVDKVVCGNDKSSYSTICALNEEAIRRGKPDKFNPQLFMEYWGPCKEAPVIISPPTDSYGPLGANLTLDCEARGYPAPEITWKFVSAKGETISLPNDDQSVSIQMRGGPEPLMVTGWAQIMSLDPSYIGIYHCIATNSEGQVHSMASVGVYKNEL